MAVKFKIKKGDQVKIIAGDDKGKTGTVKAVFPKKLKLSSRVVKWLKRLSNQPSKIHKAALRAKRCLWIFQTLRW